ncbi:hypothetical protein LZC95_20020 [Pendulispora brunnea]|uniref:Uncharacterized protein n=1 Tax=Pendulispora brunnea TaxID=2905690 RepID=A0ABZ2KN45_9BACT
MRNGAASMDDLLGVGEGMKRTFDLVFGDLVDSFVRDVLSTIHGSLVRELLGETENPPARVAGPALVARKAVPRKRRGRRPIDPSPVQHAVPGTAVESVRVPNGGHADVQLSRRTIERKAISNPAGIPTADSSIAELDKAQPTTSSSWVAGARSPLPAAGAQSTPRVAVTVEAL